ncbi:DUF1802 family protein [Geitlerinema sp. PCC 9228]|jgi:hypothetical protein|uniref:DUF1802 family protein n=1 Tax=Geitlerinema sp. PCC 9228 TaxID=111611 RepID=UPI0008F9AC54|nr:DUF1802 family protein [Geitlerinema sp. PCC 9228]
MVFTETPTLTKALKEWAVAVNAIQRGETIMLLRKGGIRETNHRFQVDSDRIFLYPTYEHQNPNLLKPEYASQVTPVTSGWHPETIPIAAVADITHIFRIQESATLDALFPFHIWNQDFASKRFRWKPKQPLYVLLLQAYQLPQTVEISYDADYGGCRSWIDLKQPISLEGMTPVLTPAAYEQKVEKIRSIVKLEPSATETP